MKKRLIALGLALGVMLNTFSGCADEEGEITSKSIDKIQEDIDKEFEEAKNGKYENLVFECDGVDLPEVESLSILKTKYMSMLDDTSVETAIESSLSVVAKLMDVDVEKVNKEYLYDSSYGGIDLDKEPPCERNYNDMMTLIDEYTECPHFYYYDKSTYQEMELMDQNATVHMSHGVISSYLGKYVFWNVAEHLEHVRSYNCTRDVMDDTYKLIDGEISVAEAKKQMEAYLDEHFPVGGEDTGIKNEIYYIDVYKVPDKDIYFMNGARTFSYAGVPFKAVGNGTVGNACAAGEYGVMGECWMAEQGKLDIVMGMANVLEKPETVQELEEIIAFDEVLSKVSVYMSGKTDFVISKVGIEYRMFINEEENSGEIIVKPYWAFYTTNKADKKYIKVYVDVQTGKIDTLSEK